MLFGNEIQKHLTGKSFCFTNVLTISSQHKRDFMMYYLLVQSRVIVLKICVIYWLVNISAFALEYKLEEYSFPIKDYLYATIFSALNAPAHYDYQEIKISLRPERAQIPIFGNKHQISLAAYLQNGPAPMVFVIHGVGGNGLSGNALQIAESLHAIGYHAITLPNHFSWSFALGASKTGIPGDLPQDTQDMIELMREIQQTLKTKYQVKITSYSLAAFSLGAVMAASLAQMDLKTREFDFQKVVLINPSVSIAYGIQQLDAFYQAGSNSSQAQKDWISSSLMIMVENYFSRQDSDTLFLIEEMKKLQLTNNNLQWIIGNEFRTYLRDIIVAGQAVNDLGILKIPATTFRLNARLKEASQFSFQQYLEIFLTRSSKKSIKSLVEMNSLLKFSNGILKTSKVYVVGNVDDFIVSENDVNFLRTTFPGRLILYPLGGHMGNSAFPKNIRNFQQLFTKE